MKNDKIRFTPNIKSNFIDELRDKIKEYFEMKKISKYGNANMVVKSIFMVSLYLVLYILMLSGTIYSLPGIIICWVIMGLGLAGVGMSLMHDANHGAYSKNRKINKLLGRSLYLLGAFPATWQYQHNWAIHQLMTTSDFSPKNKVFSWLIGGLNYQVVHHLFPNICHVHYKNISCIVKETAQKYNVPYYVHSSFFIAIRNHTKMLKMLGSAS